MITPCLLSSLIAQHEDNMNKSRPLARASAPMKILIADDDASVVKGFDLILRDAGYNVVGIAHDGMEAVELATATRPDLILMDIKMPRMDGINAARIINGGEYGNELTPIILVTAYAEQQLVQKAKSCGVLGYLVKPVHVDDLVPAIELAYSTAQTINALEGVVDNLTEELEARKLIEKAKGILMKHLSIHEDDAMRMMQKESRNQRIKMKDLAQAIIASYSVLS